MMNKEIELIDKEDLIKKIEYSNKWNNVPCPQWVLNIIKNMTIIIKMQD